MKKLSEAQQKIVRHLQWWPTSGHEYVRDKSPPYRWWHHDVHANAWSIAPSRTVRALLDAGVAKMVPAVGGKDVSRLHSHFLVLS